MSDSGLRRAKADVAEPVDKLRGFFSFCRIIGRR